MVKQSYCFKLPYRKFYCHWFPLSCFYVHHSNSVTLSIKLNNYKPVGLLLKPLNCHFQIRTGAHLAFLVHTPNGVDAGLATKRILEIFVKWLQSLTSAYAPLPLTEHCL